MAESPEKVPMGDALVRLIAGIDLDFSLPAAEIPHAVRSRVQGALDSPELYLDSARRLLSQLVSDPDARFLFVDPRSRYTLQIFADLLLAPRFRQPAPPPQQLERIRRDDELAPGVSERRL
jgi:hypothetical protein